MKQEYKYAIAPADYETSSVQLTVKDKDKGEKVQITIQEWPDESEWPGGSGWMDEEGKPITNPWYAAALKYTKDHEFAPRRRDGETLFKALHRPETGERGAPQRKAATVLKDMDKAMENDKDEALKQMALRRMARKGGTYADALAFVTEEWS